MPQRPPTYRPPGPKRTPPSEAARGTAAERGYGSRWQQARLSFLAANPLCVECKAAGVITEATTVDHVIPHRGDQSLFWDVNNWQSLCTHHHAVKSGKGQ